MRNYRLHWDAELGWILDVDVLLSARQIDGVCHWAIPHQIKRWIALPLGAKKDELHRAIKLLEQRRVLQRLVHDANGEASIFKATQGTGKIISIGGL